MNIENIEIRDKSTGKLYKLVEILSDSELKVAFVVGHCESEEGATFSDALEEHEETMVFSEALDETEFDFWEFFAREYLGPLGTVFLHEDIKGYSNRQELMAEKTKDFDLVFELHFNASHPDAHGSEALYYHTNEKTKLICEKFSSLMHEKMGYKNRGAKPITKDNRGGGFVYNQIPPAIILEPFFGSNKNDCQRFHSEDFVAILKELIEYAKEVL